MGTLNLTYVRAELITQRTWMGLQSLFIDCHANNHRGLHRGPQTGKSDKREALMNTPTSVGMRTIIKSNQSGNLSSNTYSMS
jgi:hypothetical protein